MGDIEWLPLEPISEETGALTLERLLQQRVDSHPAAHSAATKVEFPVVGVFQGFSLDESPLVVLSSVLPGEILTARSTVALTRDCIGDGVVVVCEGGDPYRPIVIGLLEQRTKAAPSEPVAGTTIIADDERYVITAEREIVLRCGDSSITLTRAGKVIIKGNYILSRSTGYNKIKGAAVDIN